MKKLTVSLLGASLLAGALFANSDHMGNHMHEGKMMNHSNMSGMTDKQMAKMMDTCKQAFLKSQKEDVSSVQSKKLQQLNKVKELFSSDEYSG